MSNGSESYLSYFTLQLLFQIGGACYRTLKHYWAFYFCDAQRIGPGYHWFSSLCTISGMHLLWAILVDPRDVGHPWVSNTIRLLAWQRAWTFHQRRDPRLPRLFLGRLQPWIVGLLEMLPIPESWLSETAQSRYWLPGLLYVTGKVIAIWLCPATGALMQFSAIVLVVPAVIAGLKEAARQRRFEAMIQSVDNSLAPSPFTPAAGGRRGDWAEKQFARVSSWFDTWKPAEPESVCCPTCQQQLACGSLASGCVVRCPCGQQFRFQRR